LGNVHKANDLARYVQLRISIKDGRIFIGRGLSIHSQNSDY